MCGLSLRPSGLEGRSFSRAPTDQEGNVPASSAEAAAPRKVTPLTFRAKKAAGELITVLTATDLPLAQAVDEAGLVGYLPM